MQQNYRTLRSHTAKMIENESLTNNNLTNNGNDVSDTLNNNFREIMMDLKRGSKINLDELNIKFDEIREKVIHYNKSMDEWFDKEYYDNLENFKNQLEMLNEKINLYEVISSINFV